MKAYLYDVFHRCDSITDWTPDKCSLALSSTQKVEGKYSIKMTADDNQHSNMVYTRTVDWSEFGHIIFSVYHPGWTNETGYIVLFTSAIDYKYWVFNFAASWTEIDIDLSSVPDGSFGTLDLSNITEIKVWQNNLTTPGEDYYFDFFRGKSIDITSNINDIKITEEMGLPSFADLKIKGASLDHFQAGLEMEVYDKDDVLSWTGRILYPESVLEGTEVVGKIKALGSNSQFNNTYRKNFTTVRDSDYIIKNIIDNALTKYHSYDDEIDNFTITYKYDMKTKIQKEFSYLSMLERAVIGYKPDGEMFFNKYDNLSKGPQIYQGTYSFEDDTIGGNPAGWTIDEGGGTVNVISDLDGHKKVLELSDTDNADAVSATKTITKTANQTFDVWLGKNSVASNTEFFIFLKEGATILIYIDLYEDDLYAYDGANWHTIKLACLSVDTLVHLKIVLNDTTNTFDVYVNETLELNDSPYYNNSTVSVDTIYIHTDNMDTNYKGYVDAIGLSSDSSYSIGDNLKCWDESTSKIKITSYTPAANRHITRTPVVGANNSKGQVYYVGKSSETDLQKYGLNYLQPWRDPEITNYTEAKQLGDNLLAIYSMDTQMINMLVIGKGHLQVGKTLNMGWAGVFSITQGDFLLTKRVWRPIPDISETELTDNILTLKAFNVKIINKFYDEDAQQSYDFPDVSESTVDGTVQVLRSLSDLRANAPIVHIKAGAPDVNFDVDDGVESGDFYVDTAGTKAYICLSNTSGAADWNQID